MLAETSSRYRRSDHTEESQVGERVVLYHRGSRTALVLNPTGSWVWHLLATPHTPQSVAEQLQARFPFLTGEQAASDVAGFLHDLRQHDMVLCEA